MRSFYLLFLVFFGVLFVSCSRISPQIQDLQKIPQDAKIYAERVDVDSLYYIQTNYEDYYFRIWNFKKPSETLESVKWPFRAYKIGKSYGENLQLLDDNFFSKMYENANFNDYLKVSQSGITLKRLNIRAFPTITPLLRDPTKAGEGFPFDYLQNSAISANKPVFVSHFSKNKKWVYVFSSFASGWVESRDIVLMNEEYKAKWQSSQQIFLTKDNKGIYTKDGKYLFSSKLGMMLPFIREEGDNYIVLAVVKKSFFEPMYMEAVVPKSISHKGVLKLDKKNLINIVNEISKSHYGWGGMYDQRDCSSTMRDLFAPFGIWLPRNSSQQAKVGKVISLEGLSDNEKIKLIKRKAIPFQTLLYKRGHILLYVGTYDSKIIVFHNTWGIKTVVDGKSKRVLIGRAIFSTLELGKYQKGYNKNSSMLKKLKSFNILTDVQF